jgi:hypothetical protein
MDGIKEYVKDFVTVAAFTSWILLLLTSIFMEDTLIVYMIKNQEAILWTIMMTLGAFYYKK